MSEKVYCESCDIWISDKDNIKRHEQSLSHLKNLGLSSDEIKDEIDKIKIKCPLCLSIVYSNSSLKKHLEKQHEIFNNEAKHIIKYVLSCKEEKLEDKKEIKIRDDRIEMLENELDELKHITSKQEGVIEEKEETLKLISKYKSVVNNNNITINQSYFDKYFPEAEAYAPNNPPEKLMKALSNVRKKTVHMVDMYESILRKNKLTLMIELIIDIIIEIYKNKDHPELQSIWNHATLYALRCKEKGKLIKWYISHHGIQIVDKIIIPIIDSLSDIVSMCKPKTSKSDSSITKEKKSEELKQCSNALQLLESAKKKPKAILRDIQYWFKIDTNQVLTNFNDKIEESTFDGRYYYVKRTAFTMPKGLSHEHQKWYLEFDNIMLNYTKIEKHSRLYISNLKKFYRETFMPINMTLLVSIAPSLHNFRKIFLMFAKDNNYRIKKDSRGKHYLKNYNFKSKEDNMLPPGITLCDL